MPWPHLVLLVKNQVVEFIAMWHHLLYKFVQYRFHRCVQNNTLFTYTENHANRFRHFEYVDSQT